MATEQDLRNMEGFKKRSNFIEVKVGCTSKKYGDTVGKLRVYSNGKFLIYCECTPACKDKLSPYDFEKHAGKEGTRKWKNHIWVLLNNKKVPLWRTVLLKYYKHSSNGASGLQPKRLYHRDEFIRCSSCGIERRFRRRTAEECRIYHDALMSRRWCCEDRPYEKIICHIDEERAGRKRYRGCPRTPICKGCTTCVCFGCLHCRYLNCRCRTCVDFMKNAEP